MYEKIRKWIHKQIYKILIYKIVIIDRINSKHYDRLETFCTIDMNTDKGIFKFLFKKDKSKITNKEKNIPNISTYVIELIIPDELIPINKIIQNKIIIVVKITLFKPDYNILTEMLADMYLDEMIKYINDVNLD